MYLLMSKLMLILIFLSDADLNGFIMQAYLAFLFSGGKDRVCQINDEDMTSSGNMRFTGDLVMQSSDGSIYYRGRNDDMVKRHGKRFHLQEVEQVSIIHSA
jgi:acyl-CoA synthetase (AMP-forming)/AMP-acid ligase II